LIIRRVSCESNENPSAIATSVHAQRIRHPISCTLRTDPTGTLTSRCSGGGHGGPTNFYRDYLSVTLSHDPSSFHDPTLFASRISWPPKQVRKPLGNPARTAPGPARSPPQRRCRWPLLPHPNPQPCPSPPPQTCRRRQPRPPPRDRASKVGWILDVSNSGRLSGV